MPKRNFKIYFVIIAVLATFIVLVGSGMEEAMVYTITVKELKAEPLKYEGRGVRLTGTVVEGSLLSHAATSYEFDMLADDESLRVRYDGILPDTFRENHEVIVEGKYLGAEVFKAQHIFTKCASKYEAVPEHEGVDAK
jgi:cytochrome c-type biogenesis protein CcmE